jgi:DNA polymerase I-like protein with 3'-5' exonuclease and polymerase domains
MVEVMDGIDLDPYVLRLPNIRACFCPDPGYVLVEADLERADAQVCAWDAGCEDLKHAFATGEDIHSDNAIELYGRLPNVRALHVNGLSFRDNAKKWVHASDYAGGARTISQAISLSEDKVKRATHWWTKIRHPEIGEWHRRIEWDLTRSRVAMVRNAFGFRRMYADPNAHNILNQALAWICQSTVAVVINKAMLEVDCARDLMGRKRCGQCLKCAYYDYAGPDSFNLLLQIHDSLLLQVREDLVHDTFMRNLLSAMRITVPYPDPLIIPIEIKTSESSWGEMQKWKFA